MCHLPGAPRAGTSENPHLRPLPTRMPDAERERILNESSQRITSARDVLAHESLRRTRADFAQHEFDRLRWGG
jgi:hypothetical protein